MNTNQTYLQGIVSAVHEKEGGSEIERHTEREIDQREGMCTWWYLFEIIE